MTAGPARRIVWVLALLTAFGPMSIDMYLPSLPAIAGELGATTGEIQLTLSAFFVGAALGQLVYGPLSDRVGRRPVLLLGISLYIVTSALCALSTTVEALVAFRLLHALGSGAGTVVARAVVRDLFETDRAAQVLSLMMLVMGAAPMLAPLAGGQILAWLGWRAIFWVLTGFGCLCLIAVLTRLPESNPPERRNRAGFVGMVRGYAAILGDRTARGCILAGGFAFAGMFAYISGTPFVYIQHFDVPPEAYGFLFGLNILGMMAGAALNARLVVRKGARAMMGYGVAQMAAAGLILLALGGSGLLGLPGVVAPLFLYLCVLNPVGANAIARTTERFPRQAGAAAALFGTMQFGLGAVAGTLVGQLHDGSPLAMCAVIAGCGLAALGFHLLWGRR